MAISAILDVSRLDDGNILAPERYDPRRRCVEQSGSRLSDIVNFRREKTRAELADATAAIPCACNRRRAEWDYQLPTLPPCDGSAIGSTKNRIPFPDRLLFRVCDRTSDRLPGSDRGLLESEAGRIELLCSSEFYVLDSKDGAHRFSRTSPAESEAFNQFWLHRKRVDIIEIQERTLKSLPIPTLVARTTSGVVRASRARS